MTANQIDFIQVCRKDGPRNKRSWNNVKYLITFDYLGFWQCLAAILNFYFLKTTNRSDFYEAIRRTEARIIGLIKFNLKECASRCFQFKTSVSLCKCMPNSLCMFFFDISIVELRLYQLQFSQFPLSRPIYNNADIMLISIHMDVNRYRFTFEMFLIWFWSIFFFFQLCGFEVISLYRPDNLV